MKIKKRLPKPPEDLQEAAEQIREALRQKPPKLPSKTASPPSKSIDLIAEEHEAINTRIKADTKSLNDLRDKIKQDAAKHGRVSGDEQILDGTDYEIGFTNIYSEPQPDIKEAQKVLNKTSFDILFPEVTKREFDAMALKTMLAKNLVHPSTVRCFMKDRPPTRRILVRRKKL